MFTRKKFTSVFLVALSFLIAVPFSASADSSEVAPLSPEFVKWQESGRTGGYIPEPLDLSHLSNLPAESSVSNGLDGVATLPATYDLRDYTRLPSIRDQSPWGTCWAHAAIGALESSYMTQKFTFLNVDSPDLSELQLAWFVYKDPEEGHSFSGTASFGKNPVLDIGGNASESTAFFSRMAGPVKESSLVYSKDNAVILSNDSTKKPSNYFPLALRLSETYSLGDVTDDTRAKMLPVMKRMIMNKGAIQISYYAGSGASSPTGALSYFENNGTSTNHAVLAVGWDDNYSREKFSEDETKRPKNNGAWLVRNSWGNYTGSDKGYFWMSYEQYVGNVTVYIAKELETDTTCYYHDALGYTNHNSSAWAANVFKAESDNEAIKEIGFFTTAHNATYDLYIFDLGTEEQSYPVPSDASSYLYKSENNTEPYAGYHVKTLPSVIPIEKGHYFSVIMKMITPDFKYPTAIEVKVDSYAVPVVNKGESYFPQYITNGIPPANTEEYAYWKDGSTYDSPRNACIKAFTVKTTSTGLTLNTANFPDSNLRSALSTYDTGSKGYLTDDEIAAVKSLNLSGQNIADLQGLEYFTSLQELIVSNNLINSLNLGSLPLISLDVSGNTSLYSLNLGTGGLLRSLACNGTDLEAIDITYHTGLTLDNITCDMGTDIFRGDAATRPSFSGHSLILSGKIGVDFYVDIPDGFASGDAKVSFTVNGKTGDELTFTADKNTSNGYMFTCYLNSVQLAEVITAKVSYRDNFTVERYRAKDYLDIVPDVLPDSEFLIALANAIKDYGHYVQPTLAETNKWEYGVKYATMDYASSDILIDTDSVKTALQAYSIVKVNPETFSLQLDLELDSDTALNLYVAPAEGYSDGFEVTCTSGDVSKQPDGSYTVSITGISAHKLGESYTVNIAAGEKTSSFTASALSYANAVMQMDSAEGFNLENLKKAVTALYKYYTATMAYRASDEYKN